MVTLDSNAVFFMALVVFIQTLFNFSYASAVDHHISVILGQR